MRCGVCLVVGGSRVHWAMGSFSCQLASCCAFRESLLTSGRALLLLLDRDVVDDLRIVDSYRVEVLDIRVLPAILTVRFTRLDVHELVGSLLHSGLICALSTESRRSFLLKKMRAAGRLWHFDWRILVGSTCATCSHLFLHHTWVSVRYNFVSSSILDRLVWTLRLMMKFNPIWLSIVRRLFVHVLGVSEELGALCRVI